MLEAVLSLASATATTSARRLTVHSWQVYTSWLLISAIGAIIATTTLIVAATSTAPIAATASIPTVTPAAIVWIAASGTSTATILTVWLLSLLLLWLRRHNTILLFKMANLHLQFSC